MDAAMTSRMRAAKTPTRRHILAKEATFEENAVVINSCPLC
jgi:hypothetical protein